MNQAIYQLADTGGSIRIVIQRKPDGHYILGVSNGKDRPLIRQGARETVDAEFEASLPAYLEKLKADAIEAKLRAATEFYDEEEPEPAAASNTEEQPELDFGF